MGDNTIHYSGHIRMMGAVQPFISGAISKTVNIPEDVTVEDVEQLHIDAWRLGIKAVAIYRDNCKVAQPLSTTKKEARRSRAATRRRRGRRPRPRTVRPWPASPSSRRRWPTNASTQWNHWWWAALPRAAAPQAQLQDVLLPGGRLRGLRDGGRVRGRPPGRGLHKGVEAGFDAGRDHGRLLHRHQPESSAPGAAGHLRDASTPT